MKFACALLGLIPSLAWAQTSDAPEERSRGPAVLNLTSQTSPKAPTLPDCNSDNPSVTGFQKQDWLRRHSLQPFSVPGADAGLLSTSHLAAHVYTSRRPSTAVEFADAWQRWPGGMARLRVRGGVEGTTDYGSAVCVGFGRTPGEWTFLSCSHNFESGGEPELQLAGRWIPASLLYRDKLAEAVETAPGQYTRAEAGPDRSVLVVNWSGRLRFRPVCLERYVGQVALSGYPSSVRPVTIAGQTQEHPSAMKAALERPSQGGFSGGGVFTIDQELVGIWTSGSRGTGYGHYVVEFLPIFRQLGWAPGNWRLQDSSVAQQR